MIFKDNYGGAELVNTAEYIHISRDGTACRVSEPVLKEHLLRVYVNGRLTMRLVCTPQHMGELVLGRLLTEGIISSVEDVEEIVVSAEGDRVEARISAVSYTHLDVYKRQILLSKTRNCGINLKRRCSSAVSSLTLWG